MFTLVPSDFFDPQRAREALSDVCPVAGEEVGFIEIPKYGAVLVHTVPEDGSDVCPEIYILIEALKDCPEYNKIVCSEYDGVIGIVIAQGNNLLLANEYPAPDFTTAQYYLFLAVKSLQINPEVSTVCWHGLLSPQQEISLCRYFKSVEVIQK